MASCPHCHAPGYPGDDADLVDRLWYWHRHEGSDEFGEAAAEIERLRKVEDDFERYKEIW